MTPAIDLSDDVVDFPLSGSGVQRAAIIEEEPPAFAERGELSAHRSVQETFAEWFPGDAATVSYTGELARDGNTTEIFVHGQSLRASLDAEAAAYYDQFIVTLCTEGRAAWPGAETTFGQTQEGVVAELSPQTGEITFTYGRAAETTHEHAPEQTAEEFPDATPLAPPEVQRTTVNLDEIMLRT